MTKDEALRMALEAFKLHGEQYPHMVKGYCLDAINAIKEALAQPEQEVDWEKLYRLEVKKKEALAAKYERDIKPLTKIVPMAQPEQEPVAYGMWDTMVGKDRLMMVRLDKGQDGCTVPLYTHTPKQKPLTEQQIVDICDGTLTTWEQVRIARAIEATHGIKEKA